MTDAFDIRHDRRMKFDKPQGLFLPQLWFRIYLMNCVRHAFAQVGANLQHLTQRIHLAS